MAEESVTRVIGKRVRQRRTQLGLSQEKLGELCEIHRTYIGAVERGEKHITVVTLSRIAEALKCPIASLLE